MGVRSVMSSYAIVPSPQDLRLTAGGLAVLGCGITKDKRGGLSERKFCGDAVRVCKWN